MEQYEQLALLPFTSERKRMSVIVRNVADGSIHLYCKGADDVLMARLAPGQDDLQTVTQQHVDTFAETGLRTLVLAWRELSPTEFAAFEHVHRRAAAEIIQREAAVAAAYETVERNLHVLGATAIEDELQAGVPETLCKLRQAGIRCWMLTGDKHSTAMALARRSDLHAADASIVDIHGVSRDAVSAAIAAACVAVVAAGHNLTYEVAPASRWEIVLRWLSAMCSRFRVQAAGAGARPPWMRRQGVQATPTRAALLTGPSRGGVAASWLHSETRPRPYTLVVRGDALGAALDFAQAELGALCMSATAVVCCRVTPKQKAQVVQLVKATGAVTLAVGDGGNDVAMIQEAAIGVGVRGQEGLQAARAADYQVSRFEALQRLVLVHGRYSYHRTALVAQYSFYKSFAFCVMQVRMCLWCDCRCADAHASNLCTRHYRRVRMCSSYTAFSRAFQASLCSTRSVYRHTMYSSSCPSCFS